MVESGKGGCRVWLTSALLLSAHSQVGSCRASVRPGFVTTKEGCRAFLSQQVNMVAQIAFVMAGGSLRRVVLSLDYLELAPCKEM